jgi:hypothetical protein
MAAHRNAALDQEAHGVSHRGAAFQLDHLRPGNH